MEHLQGGDDRPTSSFLNGANTSYRKEPSADLEFRSQSADCRSIGETISRLSKVAEVDEALLLKNIQNR
jgi:hypothetical protein